MHADVFIYKPSPHLALFLVNTLQNQASRKPAAR